MCFLCAPRLRRLSSQSHLTEDHHGSQSAIVIVSKLPILVLALLQGKETFQKSLVTVWRHPRQMMEFECKVATASSARHSVESRICISKDDEAKLRRIVLSSLNCLNVEQESSDVFSGKEWLIPGNGVHVSIVRDARGGLFGSDDRNRCRQQGGKHL